MMLTFVMSISRWEFGKGADLRGKGAHIHDCSFQFVQIYLVVIAYSNLTHIYSTKRLGNL